jgi:hypothetical protein
MRAKPQEHGGEAALAAIQADRPFRGLAAVEEAEVRAELETNGRAAIAERLAIRLTVCADLFWEAVSIAATQRGSLQELDRYVARFGWLAGAALRAWESIGREQPKDVAPLIESVRRGKSEQDREE